MIRNFLSILVALAVFALPNNSFAQFCATRISTSPNFDVEAFQVFKRSPAGARNSRLQNIGITMHVVEQVAGASNIDITKLYDEIDAVNRFYNASGFQFFLCGAPRIVSGKNLYTYQEAKILLNGANHVPNTINIFYVMIPLSCIEHLRKF